MKKLENPILRGFNPDPSIICVDDNYYIANSTFEYFPGVQIHHSKDLVNWELICRPLDKIEFLNMIGNPQSGGVWAPCLSYDKGIYYLVFTDVKTWERGPFKDTHNYLMTAKDIKGPWSGPIYLNSSGFDPSLFHDDDNTKWLVNMEWDYRKKGNAQFSGIVIQQYDKELKSLVGPIKKIFKGTNIGLTEAPHIYKKDNYYYLFTAEGGTSYEHAETVARSNNLFGPYEVHPHNPLITSHNKDTPIKRAGHGSMCLGVDNKWYFVYLCGRPLENLKRCILGRETAIEEIIWEDGWPYLAHKKNEPRSYYLVDKDVEKNTKTSIIYHFNNWDFLKDFQTLRIPLTKKIITIDDRPGYLRIKGKESLISKHEQALIVRRQTDFIFEAETYLEFNPVSFQQLAGLIYRYNEENLYYLYMTYNELHKQNELSILKLDKGNGEFLSKENLYFMQNNIYLKLSVNHQKGQFYYSLDGKEYQNFGPKIDTSILSDEYANP